ncbi:MAG: hypothetical protein H7X89_02625 [Rhizobiales bacterium]|nr:hypothetical protein [Hyphomicrobiales bacterium]
MKEKIIARLIEQLEALSADSKTQLDYLRKIGGEAFLYVPVDDLLQEYDEILRLLDNPEFGIEFSKEVMTCLTELNNLAANIDGRVELGYYEALESEPFWREIRRKAARCRSLLEKQS